jgi:Tol biopolymer transport system component
MSARGILPLAAVLVALGGGAALAAKDDTLLVSERGGVAANGNSRSMSVSADGGRVAFTSAADNLSDADQTTDDIFLRDMLTGSVALVSRRSNTLLGTPGAGANGLSATPAISADGRHVVFASEAGNLAGPIEPNFQQIFVRDTQAGRTTLVSRFTGTSGAMANGDSPNADISSDGRFVAFQSAGHQLDGTERDHPDEYDIWLRDTVLGTTSLVSVTDAEAGVIDDSTLPSISADGRWVAFQSKAEDMSPEDEDSLDDIYVRDTVAGTTRLASRQSTVNDTPGDKANAAAQNADISADGRWVAFQSAATNLSASDADATTDVFVRDMQTETTVLVSRASISAGGAAGDGNSTLPAISADGRYVAFGSTAGNLSDADGPVSDVFVRDLQTGTTTLVSRQSAAAGGAGADSVSANASISADGRYVGFDSSANNLSAVDDDGFRNAFMRDVLGVPPVAPPPPPVDGSSPVLSSVSMSRKRFRAARASSRAAARRRARVGTTFRWSLSEDARTSVGFERGLRGRRVGRRCLRLRRGVRIRRRCTRWRSAGLLVLPGTAGANSAFFNGRVAGRALRPGRYRATLQSADAAGNRSAARRVGFRIVRR